MLITVAPETTKYPYIMKRAPIPPFNRESALATVRMVIRTSIGFARGETGMLSA
jgi:hypothetical protein